MRLSLILTKCGPRTNRILSLVLLVLFIQCGPGVRLTSNLPSEKFKLGKELFLKGDYGEARYWLEQISRLNIVTDFADSVHYLLAESYYNLNSFILAESEYKRLITDLPNSSLVNRAKYGAAMSDYRMSPAPQLDQEYTEKAIGEFEEILNDPRYYIDEEHTKDVKEKLAELNAKLAEKDYGNGVLYKKMGFYEAALTYLRYSMTRYNTYGSVPIIPKALYESGECYMKLENYPEARESFQALIDNFPRHYLVERAREKLSLLRNKTVPADSTSH